MSKPDIPAVLAAIRPGTQWTLDGDDYSGLTWLDDSPKPTRKTIDDAWPQVDYDRTVASIQTDRHARYVAETDPMFYRVQRGEEGLTLQDWIDAVDAIRAELPYPEPPAA